MVPRFDGGTRLKSFEMRQLGCDGYIHAYVLDKTGLRMVLLGRK